MRIQELEKKLQTMVASLPEKQEIEILLKKITDLLSQTNLVAKRFVPGKEQVDEELYYATIPLELNVRGEYQKIGAFLASLNDLPRIVNVPTIKLGKAGSLSSRESDLVKKLDVIALDSNVSGVTYRRLSPEEIKEITQRKAEASQEDGPRKAKALTDTGRDSRGFRMKDLRRSHTMRRIFYLGMVVFVQLARR